MPPGSIGWLVPTRRTSDRRLQPTIGTAIILGTFRCLSRGGCGRPPTPPTTLVSRHQKLVPNRTGHPQPTSGRTGAIAKALKKNKGHDDQATSRLTGSGNNQELAGIAHGQSVTRLGVVGYRQKAVWRVGFFLMHGCPRMPVSTYARLSAAGVLVVRQRAI